MDIPSTVIPFLQYGAFGLLALIVVAGMFFGARLLNAVGTSIVMTMREIQTTMAAMRQEINALRLEMLQSLATHHHATQNKMGEAREFVTAEVREARDEIVREVRALDVESTNPGTSYSQQHPQQQRQPPRQRQPSRPDTWEGGADDTGRGRPRR